MAATYKTEYGTVTASRPYFSFISGREAIDLTLIKPENENNGWGISRAVRSDVELTPELFLSFAQEAAERL
ncbi:hypothetical protein [Vibrio algicola]|uniref:Uncharacterized protein n=1 Tax=Vibrio algicola TaxID=2662262 RepID=A0A5Q0TMC0_9VIBR|nr:hypothetical protein [Vibrio algicola]